MFIEETSRMEIARGSVRRRVLDIFKVKRLVSKRGLN